ncbi:MAG: hypothetical protein IJ449_13270 [Clostridia bacterium]|nr:hypothetical protein [Clostridia bacterium]
MRKQPSLKKDERGLAIVEAAILLPLCILMILAVYYAAIFLCQRANLQANLQNTLVYYKNVDSDCYVELADDMAYNLNSSTVEGTASSYGNTKVLFPYRFFGLSFKEEKFEKFFHSMSGYMFFDDGDDITLDVDTTNFIVYKTITATATQTVSPAINLSMVGIPSELTITASGEAVITNGDDFIRNTDLILDLLAETALGEKVMDMVDKVVEIYNNLKEKFGV